MNQTEKALALAKSIGGRNGLNCIAELDETAAEQTGLCRKHITIYGMEDVWLENFVSGII